MFGKSCFVIYELNLCLSLAMTNCGILDRTLQVSEKNGFKPCL